MQNIALANVHTQRVGVQFIVRGTFAYVDAPFVKALEYGSATDTARPANAVVNNGVSNFSFVHSGYKTPGIYTLTVASPGGASAVSNAFKVV
jgi:hypothetical protein